MFKNTGLSANIELQWKNGSHLLNVFLFMRKCFVDSICNRMLATMPKLEKSILWETYQLMKAFVKHFQPPRGSRCGSDRHSRPLNEHRARLSVGELLSLSQWLGISVASQTEFICNVVTALRSEAIIGRLPLSASNPSLPYANSRFICGKKNKKYNIYNVILCRFSQKTTWLLSDNELTIQ